MGFFNKFNQSSTIRDGIELDKMEFLPLAELVEAQIHVDGFFFTTGKYGKQVVVVGNGVKINMPGWAVKQFEAIAADEEAVTRMLAGEMGIKDIAELETKNGKTTSFTICDYSELDEDA